MLLWFGYEVSPTQKKKFKPPAWSPANGTINQWINSLNWLLGEWGRLEKIEVTGDMPLTLAPS
jgi:hypothetical protein